MNSSDSDFSDRSIKESENINISKKWITKSESESESEEDVNTYGILRKQFTKEPEKSTRISKSKKTKDAPILMELDMLKDNLILEGITTIDYKQLNTIFNKINVDIKLSKAVTNSKLLYAMGLLIKSSLVKTESIIDLDAFVKMLENQGMNRRLTDKVYAKLMSKLGKEVIVSDVIVDKNKYVVCKLNIFDNTISLSDNKTNPTVLIEKKLEQIKYIKHKFPEFVQVIMKKYNVVVYDIANMMMALKLTVDDINAITSLFNLAGITTISIIDNKSENVFNTTYTIKAAEYAHDDESILLANDIFKSIILTSDQYKEFKEYISFCPTHNKIVTRINEQCPLSMGETCRLKMISTNTRARFEIKSVRLENNHITSCEVSDPVILFKNTRYKHKKVSIKSMLIQPVRSIQYCNPNIVVNAPALVQTGIWLYQDFTVMKFTVNKTLKQITAGDEITCILYMLSVLTTEEWNEIIENINIVLSIENESLCIIDNSSQILTTSIWLNPAYSDNYNYVPTLLSNVFNLQMVGDCTKLDNVKRIAFKTENKEFNLESSSILINKKLIGMKMAFLINEDRIIITKLSQSFIDIVDRSFMAMTGDELIPREISTIIPVSANTRKIISDQFLSTNVEADESGQILMASMLRPIIKRPAQLMKRRSRIDADNPGLYFIEYDENIDIGQAVSGLDIGDLGPETFKFASKQILTRGKPLSNAYSYELYKALETEMYNRDKYIDINISAVDWYSREIKANKLRLADVVTVVDSMVNVVQTTFDIINRSVFNTFADIAQGMKPITLPILLLGCNINNVDFKNSEDSVIKMTWRLPTAMLLSYVVINKKAEQALYVCLHSISPPIIHRYIAARLNIEVDYDNQYNDLMIQDEEMNAFGFIYGENEVTFDGFATVMFTMYGTYASGLRLLGIDAEKVFLENCNEINMRLSNDELVIKDIRTNLSPMPSVGLSFFIKTFLSGKDTGKYRLYRLYTKNGINLSKEIHIMIDSLITSMKYNVSKIRGVSILMYLSTIIPISSTIKHLTKCFKVMLPKKPTYDIIFEKIKTIKKTNVDCIEKEIFVSLEIGESYKMNETNEITIETKYGDSFMTLSGVKTLGDTNIKKTIHSIRKSIPISGNYTWFNITSRNEQNFRTMDFSNISNLYNIQLLKIDMMASRDKISVLKDIFYQMKKHGNKFILTAYDRYPSQLQRELTSELMLKYNKNWVIHIPDELLFNKIIRHLKSVDPTSETKSDYEKLMSSATAQGTTTPPKSPERKNTRVNKLLDAVKNTSNMFRLALVCLVGFVTTAFFVPSLWWALTWPMKLTFKYGPKTTASRWFGKLATTTLKPWAKYTGYFATGTYWLVLAAILSALN